MNNRIYFAGPLFNDAEKTFNLMVTHRLEEMGYTVFLPQRDGIETTNPKCQNLSKEERRQQLFALDRNKVLESDIFLFILDGRVPDEGACVELGIAYTQKFLQQTSKILIGLQTDQRAAFLSAKLNPMLSVPLDYIAQDLESLFGHLAQYCNEPNSSIQVER